MYDNVVIIIDSPENHDPVVRENLDIINPSIHRFTSLSEVEPQEAYRQHHGEEGGAHIEEEP